VPSRDAKSVKKVGNGKGISPLQLTRVSGECHKLSQRGPGQIPAENDCHRIWKPKSALSDRNFNNFHAKGLVATWYTKQVFSIVGRKLPERYSARKYLLEWHSGVFWLHYTIASFHGTTWVKITKQHLDRFCHFLHSSPVCPKQTDTQTTVRVTSVATGCIYAMHAMRLNKALVVTSNHLT